MRSHTTSTPARRTLRQTERRTRRRPALIATALAVGAFTAVGITATAPASLAEASGPESHFALASYTAPLSVDVAGDSSGAAASTDAAHALATAGDALSAAATVAADISASGLDIGVAETSVDTTALEAAVAKLERADLLPEAFVPYFTEPVTALAATVGEQTQGLRGRLDAAHAVKAEQEAAEKARLEAEAAAAAAAQSAAKTATAAPSPVYATGGAVGGSSPADAQATARSMLAGYGWGDDQFSCLVSLWNKESGWNYRAHNASSGAYGIPQALPGSKMASAGADWQTNAATQIAWGFGYISGRYGTPCGAWSHSQSVGWY